MHPRQANVSVGAIALTAMVSGKPPSERRTAARGETRAIPKKGHVMALVDYVDRISGGATHLAAGQAVLWQYTDPEGNMFWLDRKITTTVRSPYGGPGFTTKPKKIMPSQIGKILKEEKADETKSDSKMDDADDPKDLHAFAAKALAVAKSPQSKKYYEEHVFISSVKDRGFPRMERSKFDAMLIEAHQSRLLRLSRADLVGAMDPELVRQSEVRFQSAEFHFIVIDVPGRSW